ncbi:hypothetical protein [Ferrovibrio sp.]|uniref:hypothetical protein n=1 Tax=Ferrovibrio sp. TaxID=1917215 RepID=UPI00260AE5FF|nr:hypothetical protein [Ferrovibrio sp.]
MPRRAALILMLLAGLTACSGMESSVRDLNRSLYRSWAGSDNRPGRNTSAEEAAATATGIPCFNSETGLLYTSQTGRCASGYIAIGMEQAERQFTTTRAPVAGRGAPEIAPMPSRNAATTRPAPVPQSNTPPAGPSAYSGTPYSSNAARVGEGVYALCHNDSTGNVFEAPACPAGSRWINSEEAELLQRAQLAEASWCFFPARNLLYRSRACRPGDRKLTLAEANNLWETLPADRRTQRRPSETGGPIQPVPPADAAPRSGVNATPLPAPK